MHAPPSAWPQHHTHLDAPALNFTHSDAHTLKFSSQPQPLGLAHLPQLLDEALPTNLPPLDATHAHAHNDDAHTHARTHADDAASSTRHPRTLNDDLHTRTHARRQRVVI